MDQDIKYEAITSADFFWRNRHLLGFSEERALYQTVREMAENSLDACEGASIRPKIKITIEEVKEESKEGLKVYQVTCQDNGPGLPKDVIPQAFGSMMFGSKYRLMQNRGQFGIGVKGAVLYAQITTGKPAIIRSCHKNHAYEFAITINLKTNEPIVHSKEKLELSNGTGTIIRVIIATKPSSGKTVSEYLTETAVSNPQASIKFKAELNSGIELNFEADTSLELSEPPVEVAPHPHGVDIELLKRLAEATKRDTVYDFLKKEFSEMGSTKAHEVLEKAGIDVRKKPQNLDQQELRKLKDAMLQTEFRRPSKEALRPIGEEALKKGLEKVYKPEFTSVSSRHTHSYEGHPFKVEVGLAYGGEVEKLERSGIELARFANKIPLLWDSKGDVSWYVVDRFNWKNYKIDKETMKVVVVTHICSTKVPYKTAGKEIVSRVSEIEEEIELGLKEVARELEKFVRNREKSESKAKRRSVFQTWFPEVARSVSQVGNVEEAKILTQLNELLVK